MTDNDALKIAAKLTEAQRRHVISGYEPVGGGKWPVRNAMVRKGLATTWPWALTPLGLQVRAVLETAAELGRIQRLGQECDAALEEGRSPPT